MRRIEKYIFQLFYFSVIGGLGAFMPYFNIWLEKQDLVGSQIGFVNSLGFIVTVIVMPMWGMLADKTKKHKEIIIISLLLTCLIIFVFSFQTQYIPIVLCTLLLNITRCGIMPMADSQIVSYSEKNHFDYGSIRAMGSLGYAILSMIVGFLAEKMDLTKPLFYLYVFFIFIALCLSFFFPKAEMNEEKKSFQFSEVKELLLNKRYLFLLLIIPLTTSLIDSAHLYSGNHLLGQLGASTSIMSWMTLVTVIPEVLFLSKANYYLIKWGYKKCYLIMSFTVFIRLFVYATTSSPYLYLIVSIVHCIHVACQTVGNLNYVKENVNPHVLTTAITLMNTVVSLSQAMYGYLFGVIYEVGNSYMIFMISSLICLVGMFIIVKTPYFSEKVEK